MDVVHLHGADFDQYLPPPGPPVLITLHLPPYTYAPAAFETQRPNTYVQCVSRTQQAAMPPACPRTLEPIPNGVPLDPIAVHRVRKNYALALGRICPEKGFHLAARAARLAGVPLVLGGQLYAYPSHLAYFHDTLEPLLDPHWFQFLGPLGLTHKRRWLAEARCLLVPSQTPETSSLVAMEALASGTPVVAFRAGALPEIVEHGRTGFLVDSVQEMARAMQHVETIDPRECRRAAEARFSADRMTARYLERYAELASTTRQVRLRTAGRLNVEEVATLAGLESVRAQWLDLWQRAGASVFQHPDWLIPWCRPFHVQQPWLLALRRDTRLVGIAPLPVYPRGSERVLTLMGAGISDDQDIVVEPDERVSVLRAVWDFLASHEDAWDVVELENLRQRSLLLETPPSPWRAAAPERTDVRPVLSLSPHLGGVDDLQACTL